MHLLKFEWYRVSCSDELVVLNTHCLVLLQIYINLLWPGDAIWRHGSRWTLTQVMSCCLMTQSHYLNQCWLIIGFLWHSLETNFTLSAQAVLFEFQNCTFNIIATSTWLCFYQTRSAWSMDQGSNRKHSAVHNFAPTVTKFCVMWEGQALPHDTKFSNCRCEIVGRRVIFIWSLIPGSSWSGLIKAEPGQWVNVWSHCNQHVNCLIIIGSIKGCPIDSL